MTLTSHAQVKASQLVARQRVCTALEHHGAGAVPVHDVLNDGAENVAELDVANTIAKGHVDRVALALLDANVAYVTRSGEKVTKLVERSGHDSVGGVEGLLNTVSVVDVNVNVEDTKVDPAKRCEKRNSRTQDGE